MQIYALLLRYCVLFLCCMIEHWRDADIKYDVSNYLPASAFLRRVFFSLSMYTN